MAHRGHQIIRLINKVAALIYYYGNRNANEPLNPYLHEGCVEIITEEIKELNNYSFFDYDTPLHIVQSYEDKVSNMLSRLYDINDFEELLTEFRWMYFNIQSERCQIDNLQHEATNQPASPLLAYYNGNAEKIKAFKLELQKHVALTPKIVISAFLSQDPIIREWTPKDIADVLTEASGRTISAENIKLSKPMLEYWNRYKK